MFPCHIYGYLQAMIMFERMLRGLPLISHELVMFGFPAASDAMKSLSGPKELRGAEAMPEGAMRVTVWIRGEVTPSRFSPWG